MVSKAIAEGDLAALNYFIAEKYVKSIQALAEAPNQKVFIMPLDLASLAGTLGGIAEIASSALGEGRAADSTRPVRPLRNVVPPSPSPAGGANQT